MNYLLIILGCAGLTAHVVWANPFVTSIRPDIKPFNCSLCFGFWSSLIVANCFYFLKFETLLIAFTTSILAEYFEHKIRLF